jgi:hypothetical protein
MPLVGPLPPISIDVAVASGGIQTLCLVSLP